VIVTVCDLQPAGVGIDDAHVGKRRHAGQARIVRRGMALIETPVMSGGSLIPVIVKVFGRAVGGAVWIVQQ